MLDDHEIICVARNELADALKVLLKPEIMGAPEFIVARNHTQLALNALHKLLEMEICR
jgi:hypothetical protein